MRFHFLKFLVVILVLICPTMVLGNPSARDSLLTLLKESKTNAKRAEIYISLSTETLSINNKESLAFAQQAIFFAKKTGDHNLMLQAYKNTAKVFYTIGILDQALTYFGLAADEAAKAGNEFDMIKNQLNVGLIYISLEDFNKALIIYERGDSILKTTYALAKQKVPLADQITIHLNLGICNTSLGKYAKGYAQFDKALALAQTDSQLQFLQVKILAANANALLKENNISLALAKLKQAEGILNNSNDRTLLMVVRSLKATAEEQNSNYAKAVDIFNQLYQESLIVGNVVLKRQLSHSLYKNYDRLKKADSAVKYLRLSTEYDKEANVEQAKDSLMRKELLMEFADREKMLVERQTNLGNRLVYFLIGAVILTFVLLGWLLFFRRKYRESDLRNLKMRLEAERMELEQQQLQARLLHHENQLAEFEYKLSKNAMLESLVGELQYINTPDDKKSDHPPPQTKHPTQVHQSKVWDEFELRFLQTHTGFYDKLLTVCPSLTLNERRLCAFLRLDMTTKEISVITGQTVRAIEIARIRLRKKLNLTQSETSLFEYFSKL